MLVLIINTILYYSIIISYHIILYIIKVGLRCGCATWLHQIAEILLNFYIFLRTKKE